TAPWASIVACVGSLGPQSGTALAEDVVRSRQAVEILRCTALLRAIAALCPCVMSQPPTLSTYRFNFFAYSAARSPRADSPFGAHSGSELAVTVPLKPIRRNVGTW